LVDLDYSEDSKADIDMNIVVTHSGKFLEVQGTAENSSFSKEQLDAMLDAASSVLKSSFELQSIAIDGKIAES
jgi:ribonuclease PH